ncbi:MAG: MFS transporter [Acetobacteraceae bacterium]
MSLIAARSSPDLPVEGNEPPLAAADDRYVVGLVSVGHFFSHFYLLALPPLFLILRDEFQVGFAALGLAMTCYNLVGGVLQGPVGFLVDRLGARYVLIGGLAMNAAAMAGIGLVDAYWQIIALALVAGIGNSVFHPADYSILSAAVRPERLARAFSVHSFAAFVGGGVAPMTIGALAAFWDWRIALIATSAAGVVLAALMLVQRDRLVDERDVARRASTQDTPGSGSGSVVLNRAVLIFFLFFAAFGVANAGLYNFTASALTEAHGIDRATAGIAMSAALLGMPAGVLLGGWLAERDGRHHRFVALWMTVAGIAAALPAFVALDGLPLIATLTVVGMAFGASLPPRDVLIRLAAPAGGTGRVFGFVFVGNSLGIGLAPIAFGWLIDHGAAAAVFAAMGAFYLVSMGLVLAAQAAAHRRGADA